MSCNCSDIDLIKIGDARHRRKPPDPPFFPGKSDHRDPCFTVEQIKLDVFWNERSDYISRYLPVKKDCILTIPGNNAMVGVAMPDGDLREHLRDAHSMFFN